MVDRHATFFNNIYDRTYNKTALYVISKCGNTDDIADILQEIYLELYSVIVKKGEGYILNEDAFLVKIAKAKIYRHYSLAQKLRRYLPYPSSRPVEVQPMPGNPHPLAVDIAGVNAAMVGEVWQILKSKPQQTQKIFYLYYYCGLKLGEICTELNMSQAKVKHKLYRTLGEIRMTYGKDGL